MLAIPSILNAFRRRLWYPAIAAHAMAVCASVLGTGPQYTVHALGPQPSTADSIAAINNQGVAAYSVGGSIYLWQNGISTQTGVVNSNRALAINDSNHIAASNNSGSYIFRNSSTTFLGSLGNEGGATFVGGLNDSDVVVGHSYRSSQDGYRAFTWQNGTLSQLPGFGSGGSTPNFTTVFATAINASGTIVGEYELGTDDSAVYWSNGTIHALPNISGYTRGGARAINTAGQIVGLCKNGSYLQAVKWDGTTPTALGIVPGYDSSIANGVNDSGAVVGRAYDAFTSGPESAFVSMNGQLFDLNNQILPSPGWHLGNALAINNAGMIVGYGTLNGVAETFVLTPVPSPHTLSGLAIAAVCAGTRRRRH